MVESLTTIVVFIHCEHKNIIIALRRASYTFIVRILIYLNYFKTI